MEWNGLLDPSASEEKYTKILFKYIKNKEDYGCTDRNFEAHLISGI